MLAELYFRKQTEFSRFSTMKPEPIDEKEDTFNNADFVLSDVPADELHRRTETFLPL